MCGWSCAGYWLWVSRHEGGDQLLLFDQNLPYCQVQALALTILGIVGLLVLSWGHLGILLACKGG